jgi:hypothetical protein
MATGLAIPSRAAEIQHITDSLAIAVASDFASVL